MISQNVILNSYIDLKTFTMEYQTFSDTSGFTNQTV